MFRFLLHIFIAWLFLERVLVGQDLIGLGSVKQWHPELDGSGVAVAQPEAGSPAWQVNPQSVSQPDSLFRWISSGGTVSQFPNGLGEESGHANQVGGLFYGLGTGLVPGVARVDNYEASHFYGLVQALDDVGVPVVNQSFSFGSQIATVDQQFDDHATHYGLLFISGVGNQGRPASPATGFNGIGVAAYGGMSSVGPTADGRCKPDLTAPGSLTSFSTPLVAGAAVLLLQAASNGVGGVAQVAEASDFRILKAMLLNGAEKPIGWTNGPMNPLDARYGAGVLNAFNSLSQLRGGKHVPGSILTYGLGESHAPALADVAIPTRRGWDLNSLSSTVNQSRGAHYTFELGGTNESARTLRATLVWARQEARGAINNLDMYLFDGMTGDLLAASESSVDNVEHIYATGLAEGRYVIQVLKRGGIQERVTASETYALAIDFYPGKGSRLRLLGKDEEGANLRLEGEPHERYRIESSPDLEEWHPVTSRTLPAEGWLDLMGMPAPSLGVGFYRARLD